MKHSGYGITSLVIALVMFVIGFLDIGAAGFLESSTAGGMDEEDSPAVLIGLILFGVWFGCLVGLAFGIAGFVQSERRDRTFPTLGVVLNVGVILMTVGIMVMGLSEG